MKDNAIAVVDWCIIHTGLIDLIIRPGNERDITSDMAYIGLPELLKFAEVPKLTWSPMIMSGSAKPTNRNKCRGL
ncbi:hypothetical protein GDO78_008189 [Eleutherodactylus coqui]|uniref:Uncharacterized protein n=1 Tax=Eleutherodactylus coqui TaxID=57060 RepID=A0A8J6FCN3_ELECQ|nr:hypothetical protein GDO78_008189 [Eleutherodactylus coqui]